MHIPIKVTTDYTLLKSLIKIPELIKDLKKLNITTCGICDEFLYGTQEFYNLCKKNNIKPLIGLEIKLLENTLYLYAKNYDGLKNIYKINTIKETSTITLDDLNKYSKDVILVIPNNSLDLLQDLKYSDIYLGFTNVDEKNKLEVFNYKKLYIPNINILNSDDEKYLKFIDKIRGDDKTLVGEPLIKKCEFNDDAPEFINSINIEMTFNKRYIPKYKEDTDSWTFLKNLCIKGLGKRLNGNILPVYQKRLEYELSVINKMGFVDYFLICYDYVLYAKKNNILVGPGRGSSAGSLVSFSIGITDIDPIKYNLLFERFLNPSRITMPDIDIDFDAEHRDEVIDYVRGKYGEKKVALGLTFTTLKSKMVLREVAKVLKISQNIFEGFIKNIDGNKTLEENYQNEIIKKYLNNYKELYQLYKISLHLEGLKKNTSTHAAGVVISSIDLDEIIPIHYSNDVLYTGITLDYIEDMGLLKMDFLSLSNLTTIANIKRSVGFDVLKDIDLEDKKVYALFSSGKTDGIFQFETPLMKDLVVKLKPKCFNDLVIAVALGRPGPKEHQNEFFKRASGKMQVTFIHDSLKDILKETFGIIIYQEQIMAILNKVAGYSLAEADIIRRAISKKKESILVEERENFIKRASERGYGLVASTIYDNIVKFASYGFNKSHSVAYALVAYQMAYLKVNYPAFFLIEELNGGTQKNITSYFSYLKKQGFVIHKPSVNNENLDFCVSNKNVYMPLSKITNVSGEISKKILENKKEKYSDFFDFCYKNKDILNEKLLHTLINAGAFDVFNITHQTLDNLIEPAINYANLQDESGMIKKPIIKEYPEYSNDILRNNELDSFGFFITNHPSSIYSSGITKLDELEKNAFKKVKCVVLIDRINVIKTKKNEDMAFIRASDEFASADFTVFPDNLKYINSIKEKDLVEISGEIRKRFDKYSIIVNNIRKVG